MKNAFTPLTLHEKWSIWRTNKESSMILSWPLAAKLLSCQTAKKPIKHRDLYLKWPAHIKKQLCNRNLLVSIISCAYRMKSKSEQHWGSCFKFAPWQPKNLSSKFNYTVSTRSDFMSFSWISYITMEIIAERMNENINKFQPIWFATEISIPDDKIKRDFWKREKKITQYNQISLPHLNRSVKSFEWSIALHWCLYLEHVKL